MDGREQLRVDRAAGKTRLNRRSRTRRLSRGDTDDQDRQVTGQHGELGFSIKTGKAQIQRNTRTDSGWSPGLGARG